MKSDGNVAGTKFLTERGPILHQKVSRVDHSFAMIPLLSNSREAECCVIIFLSKNEFMDFIGK